MTSPHRVERMQALAASDAAAARAALAAQDRTAAAPAAPAGPYVTPLVRALATQHGVDVKALKGSGAGGRIRKEDVLNAAGVQPAPAVAASQLRAPIPGPAYAHNPLVARAAERDPQRFAKAAAKNPKPTLFASGDLPVFTASGIDPQALLNVPWQARHPIAAAGTTAQAYQLLQDFSGPDAEAHAEVEFSAHSGNRAYEARVSNWIATSMTEDEHYAALFGDDDQADRKQ